ncbi:MAG: chromosome segregation protein SMC [Desulfuromonadales bacterium]|nr:chromosome segregation protein SMC [Desulfuromonadales bacterium]
MKIRRVDILGFKSFVDRISLDLQEGVTAILGPNGCGKSNIVDAIRWVMGEQNAKHLRGRSMEDVIFGGSETRKPLGMAEVSIVFGNEDGLAPVAFRDYAEIMVTRRLHRSGESEYLINKSPCRLLDITELFMDTGVGARAYSVIEQGKIGMILNAKPEDRRFLIEEAAGVTKYKSRKKSALRKIDATRQNLLRLGDIVAEVRRQVGSLKRQAQRAERFRQLREELRGIEVRFARQRFAELQSAAAETAHQEQTQQQLLAGASASLAQGEVRLEELRLGQLTREKEVNQGQERVFHLSSELQKVEGRLESDRREADTLTRQKERLATEESELVRRLAELTKEEEGVRGSQGDFGAELQKELQRLAEGEIHLEECAGLEHDLASRLETARTSLYALLTELSRLGSRQEEIQRRLQTQSERVARNRSEAVSVREQMAQADELIAALDLNLQGFRRCQDDLRQDRQALQEKQALLRRGGEENENGLLVRREELNRQRSRLDSLRQLEQSLERYGRGVQLLLGSAELRHCFTGMVADALEVPSRYEGAVEAVLGERVQALLAANPEAIRQPLDLLRQHEGRCTFLLPGFLSRSPIAVPPGGEALADLVEARSPHAEAVKGLLHGIFLVDSLAPYLGGAVPVGVTLVTEEGDILTCRGEVTGGGKQSLDHGLLHQRREMKELDRQTGVLTEEVAVLQAQRQDLRDEMAAAEEELREVEAGLHRQELKVVDSEKDRDRLRREIDRLQDRLEILSLEEDQLHGEAEELQGELGQAAHGGQELGARKSELEGVVARLQEEMLVLRRETETVRERVTSLKVAVAAIREREEGSRRSLERLGRLRQELQGRLAIVAAQQGEGERDQERLAVERGRLQTEMELLFQRREEEKGRFDRLRETFEAGARQIESQQEALKGLRLLVDQGRSELAQLQLRGRELALEADHLCQGIMERFRLDLAEPAIVTTEPFEAAAAQHRAQELRRQIEEIGEVNLTAIEEYRELEARHLFLSTQQEDLRQSLEGLQTAITKINRTTRKRFRETFDLVNARFQEVFPRLFRGGRAELSLTDEEDLLETGIEIVVQPPGKKLQSVNLLSGGEKALTAVALIFSIFLIKPSPFCLLDEVDAPLDDANIGRFNEMIHEMAQNSQFIIITHSKRTMEVADTLYGVTMEEPGVSKIVSVRLNDYAA